MLLALMAYDTEVAAQGALHRSMTPAMATMATAAQVLVFPMSVV
jgi:hypothetical protein